METPAAPPAEAFQTPPEAHLPVPHHPARHQTQGAYYAAAAVVSASRSQTQRVAGAAHRILEAAGYGTPRAEWAGQTHMAIADSGVGGSVEPVGIPLVVMVGGEVLRVA